jgi:AraC-like DNA-binding protein
MDRQTQQISTHPATSESEVLSYARHDVFTDSDHLGAAVRHADLELMQQGCGRFRGDLSVAALGGTMVQFIHMNQTSISRAANAPGRLALLIQLAGAQACLWNGYESQGSSVITYGPGHEHFGTEPKEFSCAFLSIPMERIELLLECCHGAGVGRLRTGCHQIQAPVLRFCEIQKRLAELQAVIDSKPMLLTYPAIRQMFEHSLEESLLSFIHTASQNLVRQDSTDRQSSGNIIRQTEQFLESHPVQPSHLIELCSAIGVSPERLRRAFREILNVDAKHYLRTYRLRCVRRILLASDPSTISIESLARRWGFWSRLQFEAEYRRMFAELPIQTLVRAS